MKWVAEKLATRGNGELAWSDKQLVDTGRSPSLDSSAVCNEHRSGSSAGRTKRLGGPGFFERESHARMC